jgi:hypothetical protein
VLTRGSRRRRSHAHAHEHEHERSAGGDWAAVGLGQSFGVTASLITELRLQCGSQRVHSPAFSARFISQFWLPRIVDDQNIRGSQWPRYCMENPRQQFDADVRTRYKYNPPDSQVQ